MPVSTRLEVQGDEEVIRALRALGVRVIPLTKGEIFDALLSLRNRVAKTGSRPTYPINWDSEKQRRAYFYFGGFGGGIPTTRTGRHRNAWRVVKSGTGYAIENPLPSAVYVYGDEEGKDQSKIHQGRWPLWASLIDEHIPGDVDKKSEISIQRYANRQGL